MVFGTLGHSLWQSNLIDIFFNELLNFGEALLVCIIDECQPHTGRLCPCRATDPVDVVLRVMRHIKIDDHTDVVDIYSTADDIRCYQNLDVSVGKVVNNFLPFSLLQI